MSGRMQDSGSEETREAVQAGSESSRCTERIISKNIDVEIPAWEL